MERKLLLTLLCAIALAQLLTITSAQAQRRQTASSPQKIDVTADKLSSGNGANRIEASGNVEIKRDQTTLKANEVQVDRSTQDITAKGKVSLEDPEWKVRSADAVDFNLDRETGSIQNGDLFIEEGHISMMGRRLQKLEGQSYHVDDGFFTTCLCEPGSRPSWKFSADQMDLTLEGLGTIKNGYFYIMDVPVMYFPYAFFPLRTERQTGFLPPNFGHSTREGFRFQQPFFWAISKSTDMTVAASVESRARAGLWGEFRTIFRDQNDFRLNASYFNEAMRKNESEDIVDRTIADQNIPKNRWSLIGTHRYTTAYDWLTYSDFAAYRDDLFARELVERFDLPATQESKTRVSRFSESRMGVFRGWSDTFIKGEVKFYQDFIQRDAITLQRTPQLQFWGRRVLEGLPFEFRWRTEAVNYVRRQGGDGLRMDFRPEVVLPYNLNSYVFGALSVAPRETVYHLYRTPANQTAHNVSRETVEIRGNVATSFSRVFDWAGLGVNGVRHVVEPEISYLFVPDVYQKRIPIMDAVDRVNRRNVLTFALANRLWGKPVNPLAGALEDYENLSAFGSADIRELAALKLALSYDIDRARRGGDTLTDLGVDLRLSPASYINLNLLGGIDPGAWNISNVRATLSLTDPRPLPKRSLDADFNRPNMFSVNYSFLRAGPNGFLIEDANVDLDRAADCTRHRADPRCGNAFNKNIAGSLGSTLLYHLLDNMLVYFSSTYDARDNRFIGFSAASKVLSTCECWSVTLGLRHHINPAKTTFNFDFNLLGLGASKSSLK